MLSLFISILLLAHLRIEGVPQTVAEEVEADHQEAEDECGRAQVPPLPVVAAGPSLIREPKDASGTWIPSPIKLKNASAKIAAGIVNIRFITMSPRELGIRCFHTSLNPLAPREREASVNS